MSAVLPYRGHRPTSERTALAEILDALDLMRDEMATRFENDDALMNKTEAADAFNTTVDVVNQWPVWFTPDGMTQVRTTRRGIKAYLRRKQDEALEA